MIQLLKYDLELCNIIMSLTSRENSGCSVINIFAIRVALFIKSTTCYAINLFFLSLALVAGGNAIASHNGRKKICRKLCSWSSRSGRLKTCGWVKWSRGRGGHDCIILVCGSDRKAFSLSVSVCSFICCDFYNLQFCLCKQ